MLCLSLVWLSCGRGCVREVLSCSRVIRRLFESVTTTRFVNLATLSGSCQVYLTLLFCISCFTNHLNILNHGFLFSHDAACENFTRRRDASLLSWSSAIVRRPGSSVAASRRDCQYPTVSTKGQRVYVAFYQFLRRALF